MTRAEAFRLRAKIEQAAAKSITGGRMPVSGLGGDRSLRSRRPGPLRRHPVPLPAGSCLPGRLEPGVRAFPLGEGADPGSGADPPLGAARQHEPLRSGGSGQPQGQNLGLHSGEQHLGARRLRLGALGALISESNLFKCGRVRIIRPRPRFCRSGAVTSDDIQSKKYVLPFCLQYSIITWNAYTYSGPFSRSGIPPGRTCGPTTCSRGKFPSAAERQKT